MPAAEGTPHAVLQLSAWGKDAQGCKGVLKNLSRLRSRSAFSTWWQWMCQAMVRAGCVWNRLLILPAIRTAADASCSTSLCHLRAPAFTRGRLPAYRLHLNMFEIPQQVDIHELVASDQCCKARCQVGCKTCKRQCLTCKSDSAGSG